MDVLSAEMLASEMIARVEESKPFLVCVGAMAPSGLAHARYLCKRIRARFPELKILVGRWGAGADLEKIEDSLKSAGVERVAGTLGASREQLLALLTLTPETENPAAARRTAS